MGLSKNEIQDKSIKELFTLAKEFRIKIEKDALAGKKLNDEHLDNLELISQEIMEFSKSYLISSEDRFYGNFLLELNGPVIDFSKNAPASISVKSPFTLYVNPLRWVDLSNGLSYTFGNVLGDIIHEILHVVFGHPADYIVLKDEISDFKIFNYAADAPVNDTILNDSRDSKIIKLTKDVITSSTIKEITKNPTVKSMEDIYYYYDLIKNHNFNNEDNRNSKKNSTNKNESNFKSDSRGKISTRFNETPDGDGTFGIGEDDEYDDVKIKTREKVRVVWDTLNEKDRERLSSNIKTAIKDLFEIDKADWEELFSRYISTLPNGYKRAPFRPNRMQPHRYDLRGKITDKIVDVVTVIDTSASMVEEDLRFIITQIRDIMKGRNSSIRIIECDTKIGRNYVINDFSDFNFDITGGGGTQFSPVFEYMNDNVQEFQDTLVLYLTDGGGERELSVKPINDKIIWLIIDGPEEQLSLSEPYGDVRSLHDDLRYKSRK
jgi:predicted metal-dependent peptidase